MLDFIPPPTFADINRRVEDLPAALGAIARHVFRRPGTSSDHLLIFADASDAAAAELDSVVAGDPEAVQWRALAAILRDAAPLYPHPPRVPADEESLAGWLRRTPPGIQR